MARSYLHKLPLALALATSLGTTAYAQSDTAAYGSSSYSNTPGSSLPMAMWVRVSVVLNLMI